MEEAPVEDKRVRLLKVLASPVFVIDDGETLEEVRMAEPITLTPGGVQHAHVQVEKMRAKLQEQVNLPMITVEEQSVDEGSAEKTAEPPAGG